MAPELGGEKGTRRVMQARREGPGPNPGTDMGSAWLGNRRGRRNSWGGGEMGEYEEENRWRRRPAGLQLTLRPESVGSKQDKIPG